MIKIYSVTDEAKTQNMKKLKLRHAPKTILPQINKIQHLSEPPFPPIHYPKGFERFSGLDKLHLTSIKDSTIEDK